MGIMTKHKAEVSAIRKNVEDDIYMENYINFNRNERNIRNQKKKDICTINLKRKRDYHRDKIHSENKFATMSFAASSRTSTAPMIPISIENTSTHSPSIIEN